MTNMEQGDYCNIKKHFIWRQSVWGTKLRELQTYPNRGVALDPQSFADIDPPSQGSPFHGKGERMEREGDERGSTNSGRGEDRS